MRFWLVFLLLFSVATSSIAAEEPRQVLIVSNKTFTDMVHRVEAALFTEESWYPNVIHLDAEDLTPERLASDDYDLLVTIGEKAFARALENKAPRRILATLIRKSQFKNILYQQNMSLDLNAPRITALFLDQPLSRQLNLVKCLIPDAEQKNAIGVILGPQSSTAQNILRQAAKQRALSLNIVHVSPSENPVSAMNYVLDESKVLLAVPDKRVYNAHTARGILLTAFRSHVPIVAFSQAYVDIGALAAVYSTPQQVALEISEGIIEIFSAIDKPLFVPKHPSTFKVAVNYQVAKTFGLPHYTESAIKYAMDDMEVNRHQACRLPEASEISAQPF